MNVPTKRGWRPEDPAADIEAGLPALVDEMRARAVGSIAALGCGLGGLSWDDVGPRIEAAPGALRVMRVLVFPPA